MTQQRDHGGGLDVAIARWGGTRETWLDLSTGINPVPFPLPQFSADCWTALPDANAQTALLDAARKFWAIPETVDIIAAPGASALISRIPSLVSGNAVDIPQPTYNEHAAAFRAQGWDMSDGTDQCRVIVHPNNPTGQFWTADDLTAQTNIIDESFCDIAPDRTLIEQTTKTGNFVLKSFGKFWGLAGLRLGFLVGAPEFIAKMRDYIGPWAVSGPALETATAALQDLDWAQSTRQRLADDCARLDALMSKHGAQLEGGCDLFRLYNVDDAQAWHERLGKHQILTRVFPYSDTYLRLGLPHPDRWAQLEHALTE